MPHRGIICPISTSTLDFRSAVTDIEEFCGSNCTLMCFPDMMIRSVTMNGWFAAVIFLQKWYQGACGRLCLRCNSGSKERLGLINSADQTFRYGSTCRSLEWMANGTTHTAVVCVELGANKWAAIYNDCNYRVLIDLCAFSSFLLRIERVRRLISS